ncbi:hypothetical protein ACISUF_11710, partial [Streptomyces sp. NPDC003090]
PASWGGRAWPGRCGRGRRPAARAVRPMTPGRAAALQRAMAARRICPACRRDAGYCIPPTLGMCVPCAYPDDQRDAA